MNNCEEELKRTTTMGSSHRSFNPVHVAGSRVNSDKQLTNQRDPFLTIVVTLNLGVTLLAACATVYLGWENYKRINENISLQSKLYELEARMNVLSNATVKSEKRETLFIKERPAPNISNNFSLLNDTLRVSPRRNNCVMAKSTNQTTTSMPAKKRGNSEKNKQDQRRHYKAIIDDLKKSIKEIEGAQNFFRSQVQQQLNLLPETSVSFTASLLEQHVPLNSGSIVQFKKIWLNEQIAYNRGIFQSPTDGIYTFTVSLVLKAKLSHSNFVFFFPLMVTLRKNQTSFAQIFKQNKRTGWSENPFDLTFCRSVTIKLRKNDRIDVYAEGSPYWVIDGNQDLISSSFSGVLLHSN